MTENTRAFLKAFSAVTGNLSAAWFTIAFITPNFIKLTTTDAIFVLTSDIISGMFFLGVTTFIERILSEP